MSYSDGPDDENPQPVEQVIAENPTPVEDTDGNPAPSGEEVTDGGE